MNSLRVLIGCERSGIVRDEFRKRGHDAWSCDLEPSERPGPHHLQGDVRSFLNPNWDLFIVHPDCTYLAVSGLHWNQCRPERAAKTEQALAFVRELLGAPIPAIALENPIGCISTRVRAPDQIIQPYYFGHDASKATCLWLKGLPKLEPTKYVEPRLVCRGCHGTFRYDQAEHDCPQCGMEAGSWAQPRWSNQTDSGQNRLGPSPTRALDRARTYEGIARAMAEQWSKALTHSVTE